MHLYYYQDPVGNFGDDLNPWLWPKLFPEPIDRCFDRDTLFVGIGSVLNATIPDVPAKKVVFGSGCGYGPPPSLTPEWRVYCVRGPLTALMIGVAEDRAITDGGLLVRAVVEPSGQAPASQTAFMPHHQTQPYDLWRPICEALGIRYLDPTAPVETTLEAIRTSGVVITEAMHGAVVADALRVPWIPVRSRPRIATFKWEDWSRSIGIEHAFEWLPPVWCPGIDQAWKRTAHPVAMRAGRERLRWLVRFGRRRLSQDRVFRAVYARLWDAFQDMARAMPSSSSA